MGAIIDVYFGPFFECTPRETTSVAENVICPNGDLPGRGFWSTDKFCPSCGSRLETVASPTVDFTPHWSDVSKAIRERLTEVCSVDDDSDGDCHRWIPNVERKGKPRDFDVASGTAVSEGGFDVAAEKAWLIGAFADELRKLIELYGQDFVKVAWGVIVYRI